MNPYSETLQIAVVRCGVLLAMLTIVLSVSALADAHSVTAAVDAACVVTQADLDAVAAVDGSYEITVDEFCEIGGAQ